MLWGVILAITSLIIWWTFGEKWGGAARQRRLAQCQVWRRNLEARAGQVQVLQKDCPQAAQPSFFPSDDGLHQAAATLKTVWQQANNTIPSDLCRGTDEAPLPPAEEIIALLRWLWFSRLTASRLEAVDKALGDCRKMLSRREADVRDLQKTIQAQIKTLSSQKDPDDAALKKQVAHLITQALQAKNEAAAKETLPRARAVVRSHLVEAGIDYLQLTSQGRGLTTHLQSEKISQSLKNLQREVETTLSMPLPDNLSELKRLDTNILTLKKMRDKVRSDIAGLQMLRRQVEGGCQRMGSPQILSKLEEIKHRLATQSARAQAAFSSLQHGQDWQHEMQKEGDPNKLFDELQKRHQMLRLVCQQLERQARREDELAFLSDQLDEWEALRQQTLDAIQRQKQVIRQFQEQKSRLTHLFSDLRNDARDAVVWFSEMNAPQSAVSSLQTLLAQIDSLRAHTQDFAPDEAEKIEKTIANLQENLRNLDAKWRAQLKAGQEAINKLVLEFVTAYEELLQAMQQMPEISPSEVQADDLDDMYVTLTRPETIKGGFAQLDRRKRQLERGLEKLKRTKKAVRKLRDDWQKAQRDLKQTLTLCQRLQSDISTARQQNDWSSLESEYDILQADIANCIDNLQSLLYKPPDFFMSCGDAIQDFRKANEDGRKEHDRMREKLTRLKLQNEDYKRLQSD